MDNAKDVYKRQEQYQPMELEILNNDFEEPLKRDLKRTAKTVKEQMMENWLGL